MLTFVQLSKYFTPFNGLLYNLTQSIEFLTHSVCLKLVELREITIENCLEYYAEFSEWAHSSVLSELSESDFFMFVHSLLNKHTATL